MRCDKPKCDFLGIHFKHLNGHEDSDLWYACNYKLPFHVIPRAVRIDVDHDCECHTKNHKSNNNKLIL